MDEKFVSMDEKYFDCWNFLYEDSEDVSIKVQFYKDDPTKPFFEQSFSTKDLKEKIGKEKAVHVEFPNSFELVIHAIKDNYVYVSVLEKSAEEAWHTVDRYALSKRFPLYHNDLVFQRKIKEGFYTIVVNEWGKLKSGLKVTI